MADGILGNAIGAFGFPKTYILNDENGNELIGVYVESETVFTATDNDVREGMVYASDSGVSTGTKDIPIYRTNAGAWMVYPGEAFSVSLPKYNQYDYTVFQCMVSLIDMNDINNSVSTGIISIKDGVYEVNSTTKLADVSTALNTRANAIYQENLTTFNQKLNQYYITAA